MATTSTRKSTNPFDDVDEPENPFWDEHAPGNPEVRLLLFKYHVKNIMILYATPANFTFVCDELFPMLKSTVPPINICVLILWLCRASGRGGSGRGLLCGIIDSGNYTFITLCV